MTKVSKRLAHDWVMVTAKFVDGTEAKVKWNRAGSDVTVTPRRPELAKTLSLIQSQALKLPGASIGRIAETMEEVAKASATLEDYVEGLKTRLNVTGEMPKPKNAPATTQVAMKQSRGWQIEGTFPSGEKFSLKINKQSVGFGSNPSIASRDVEIMNLVYSIKSSGVFDDQELAERVKEVAENSDDMDAWIEGVRGIIAPAPRR